MAFSEAIKAERRNARAGGRRQEDRALRGAPWDATRERRRPATRTDAAAQSVIMAGLAAPETRDEHASSANAAKLYSAARPQKSEADLKREAFLREAALAHQAAQRTWVLERRNGQKLRGTDVEDAEFVDI